MAVWDELKAVLMRLEDQDPRPLTTYPDPRGTRVRTPPFAVSLAAWAAGTAAELQQRFGSDVVLTVGALRYPQRTLVERTSPEACTATIRPAPRHIVATVDGPLSVRSGHMTRRVMLISNHGTRVIDASGPLIADVVDSGTGCVVGGYSGAASMVRVTTLIPPGAAAQISLLVATDSFRPDLGYAVPPGEWSVRAALRLGGHGVLTPALPMTIT